MKDNTGDFDALKAWTIIEIGMIICLIIVNVVECLR